MSEEKTKAPAPAPRKRRTYMRAPERRKQILEAARTVFAQSSFHGTRTRDIARAAQVNQATLFEHFASKEELFREAVVQPMLEAMEGLRDRAEAYKSIDSHSELGDLTQATTERQIQVLREIFPLLTSALFSNLEAGRELYLEEVVPILKERGEAFSALTKDSLDPDFVQVLTFGMLFALAMDATFRGERWDLRETARQLTTVSTTGFVKELKS